MICDHKWNRTGNDTDKKKELFCESCGTVKEIGRTEFWERMNVMNNQNELMLKQVIETLDKVNIDEIESVGMETGTYEDGSSYLTIDVDFKKER